PEGPGQRTYTINDDPPVVMVEATDATATRPGYGGSATDLGVFTVRRSGGDTTTGLTFSYTMGGTADQGSDYTLTGTESFAPGQTEKPITLTPQWNADDNSAPETATLTVQAPFAGAPAAATVQLNADTLVITPTAGTVSMPAAPVATKTNETFEAKVGNSGAGGLQIKKIVEVTGAGTLDRPQGWIKITDLEVTAFRTRFKLEADPATAPAGAPRIFDVTIKSSDAKNDVVIRVTVS
ncbi:MAG TPA: hypothetical protein VK324_15030, partial [Tepidisphaeraceae bacterium]|nr:hypothetical protein [Tepidisphaeraceae bacterium]